MDCNRCGARDNDPWTIREYLPEGPHQHTPRPTMDNSIPNALRPSME